MARAFVGVFRVPDVLPGTVPDSFIASFDVTFVGADITTPGGIDRDLIDVQLLFTDSLNVIQGKIIDRIVARAAQVGYSLARNGILMPSFVKGS